MHFTLIAEEEVGFKRNTKKIEIRASLHIIDTDDMPAELAFDGF